MIDKEKWQKRFREILSLDSHPAHIAAGFAVGTFISFTPFFGVHTPMAIAAAFLFRLNKLTCITGAWVNTPLTVAPALILSHKLGQMLLGLPPMEISFSSLEWSDLKEHAASLILGSSLLGFAAALVGYAACYWLVIRFRKKDDSLAEITREMEEVGEELDE
ncbi:hypothetical protein OR1_01997 [Geobacter sp. OR-1]|uniref:DUF2062 domain-containing protein n=1 Tax=Geobacter sp. OR-1 TaxID=1266765 RepID=UPI0005442158|nr:DUF2062 domain-containing protein [Geobacter sp. OR-1]GAM09717.1 hypothetical protein OR1_01997 [Geobacter sp. OR-1]